MKILSPLRTMAVGLMVGAIPITGNAFEIISASPADRSKVETLSVITLTLSEPHGDYAPDEPIDLPDIVGARTENKAYLYCPAAGVTTATIIIEPAINYNGTFEITVPEGCLWNEEYDSNPAFRLVYTIDDGSGSTPDNPVQYTLECTEVDPGPGSYSALETITLHFDREVFTDDNARAEFIDTANGMVYLAGRLERGEDGKSVNLMFKHFDTNGAYDLIVKQGSIGDADWNFAHHTGVSNPEYRFKYTIKPAESNVTDNFIPVEVMPNPDNKQVVSLSEITLTFDEPWTSVRTDAVVTLNRNDGSVVGHYSVSYGDDDNTLVLLLNESVREEGLYVVSVPASMFGNSEFEETEGKLGRVNPELKYEYELSATGIVSHAVQQNDVIVSGREITSCGSGIITVYAVDGRIVATIPSGESRTLDAGIYIVKGDCHTTRIIAVY